MSNKGKHIRPTNRAVRSNESQDEDEDNDDGLCECTRCLLFTMCFCVLSMEVDMYGFTFVVRDYACNLKLNEFQKSLLDSAPFVGPVVMACIWGYLSDTKGRKWTLLRGLWGGCIMSCLCAFSSNWYMLGALKIISTSLSSAVQPAAFSLIAASCPERVKLRYILLMSAAMGIVIIPTFVLWFFVFVGVKENTWKALCFFMAAPLGISARLVRSYCKSPNIVLNQGKRLKKKRIKRIGEYLLKLLKLLKGVVSRKTIRFCASLWAHLTPLFKPPLLWTTLKLLYLIFVVYGINKSLLIWLYFMSNEFMIEQLMPKNFCDAITTYEESEVQRDMCQGGILSAKELVVGLFLSLLLATITLAMFCIRKKTTTITFLIIPSIGTLGVVYFSDNHVILAMYIYMMTTGVCMVTVFVYIVELYPTAYTGMAVGLGMMVSRVSALIFIHPMGILLMKECDIAMRLCTAFLFIGVVVAQFLSGDSD